MLVGQEVVPTDAQGFEFCKQTCMEEAAEVVAKQSHKREGYSGNLGE